MFYFCGKLIKTIETDDKELKEAYVYAGVYKNVISELVNNFISQDEILPVVVYEVFWYVAESTLKDPVYVNDTLGFVLFQCAYNVWLEVILTIVEAYIRVPPVDDVYHPSKL